MVCVDGLNLDFVRSLRKTSDNDRSAAAVAPDRRCAINRYMEMPMWGDTSRVCEPNTGKDLQIFGAVPNERDFTAQRFG